MLVLVLTYLLFNQKIQLLVELDSYYYLEIYNWPIYSTELLVNNYQNIKIE